MYNFQFGPPNQNILPLTTPPVNYSTFYDSSPLESASNEVNYGTLPTYEEAISNSIDEPIMTQSPYSKVTPPCVHYEHTPSFKPLPSHIKVELSKKGAFSNDPELNSDSELLQSFFYSNNTKPRLFVDIEGFEIENINEEFRSVDLEGSTRTTNQTRSSTKYYFQLSLEVTQYISNLGSIQFANENSSNSSQSLSKLFEDYIKDENKLKAFKIVKKVNWDYEALTKALTYLIRSRGFRHNIQIIYRLENNIMKVSSDSQTAGCLSHPLSQVLCVLSCLCLIAWPIAKLYRKTHGKQLISSFPVTINPQQWYQNNMFAIISAVDNSNHL